MRKYWKIDSMQTVQTAYNNVRLLREKSESLGVFRIAAYIIARRYYHHSR